MATISRGYTFGATETVTDSKLHALVDSATISGIVNADIASSAAIDEAKINFSGTNIVLTYSNQTITGVKTFLDQPVLSSGIKTDTISERTADSGVTIDGCLVKDGKVADSDKIDGYDYNKTEIKPLGSWVSKTNDTVYQADTDGFVVALLTTGTDVVNIYADASTNPPTTLRSTNQDEPNGGNASCMIPIPKGWYWKTTGANYVWWIPMGT